MPSQLILIQTTTPNKNIAQKIANHLLTQKLAACLQISGPIESHYTWKNKHEISQEYILTIKTQKSLYTKIQEAIVTHHPYDTPEIIATPITHALPSYKAWATTVTNA